MSPNRREMMINIGIALFLAVFQILLLFPVYAPVFIQDDWPRIAARTAFGELSWVETHDVRLLEGLFDKLPGFIVWVKYQCILCG